MEKEAQNDRGKLQISRQNLADICAAVRDRRQSICKTLGERLTHRRDAGLGVVRRILVVCSASRSGSSAFVRLLTRQPGFYCLTGESATFLRLHGLAGLDGESDDVFHFRSMTPEVREQLLDDLYLDMIAPSRPIANVARRDQWELYLAKFLLRLVVQFPTAQFPVDELLQRMSQDDDGHLRSAAQKSVMEFYQAASVFFRINGCPEFSLSRYDLVSAWPANGMPSAELSVVVEEPPFETVPICEAPAEQDFEHGCLVLKCPADSYRLSWIRKLFPEAEFHFLHLKRNPAASINGLVDGWLSNGFFSRRLNNTRLRIEGYSDQTGGENWWKFDLPPGWSNWTCAPLAHVCAFQWASNNAAILNYVEREKLGVLRACYDDLLTVDARLSLIQMVGANILVGHTLDRQAALQLPLVQVTARPVAGRWLGRKSEILQAIEDGPAHQVGASLGYPIKDAELWQ